MLMLDQTSLTSTPTCGRNHRNGRAVWTETGGRFPPRNQRADSAEICTGILGHWQLRSHQVEIGRVLGLEDEFPAGMKQTEQQNIRRAVSAEVVSYRIDPLDCGIDPGLDLAQEVDPVGCRSAIKR